jgi:hypothetical protein
MKTLIAAIGISLLGTACAHSAVVVDLIDFGDRVEASYSGSLNVDGLTPVTSDGAAGLAMIVAPRFSLFGKTFGDSYDAYAISGPNQFGTGDYSEADGSGFVPVDQTGNDNFYFLSVAADVNAGNEFAFVFVDQGYTSGTFLSGAFTFSGSNFSSLGITAGTYSWTVDGTGDTITLNAAAVPLPGGLPLLLGALGGVWALRRRTGDARSG